ncbi:hypothetical protein JI739_18540 [Ramlibacter sp. AW1]|uniref:Uncharacterized protein n=1 Tax=Ramlibacter aurantiacus TaxID=2801330 RepID=A0A936ZLE8_9BURK|nr:hypothetical protein [Ramlibacter aurantiacus]MBL0422353.1 hypothetical protein [Ramlibacter aurantiacus]
MSRRLLSAQRVPAAYGVAALSLAVVLHAWHSPAQVVEGQADGAGGLVPPPVDVAGRLPGTWLREHVDDDVQSRRLLHLASDGAFREVVRLTRPGGRVTEHIHAGTWIYDGINLKRKYSLMDGRPPSRLNLPFATFEVRFESRNEFVGLDHIHRNQVRYRRVEPETQL